MKSKTIHICFCINDPIKNENGYAQYELTFKKLPNEKLIQEATESLKSNLAKTLNTSIDCITSITKEEYDLQKLQPSQAQRQIINL